MPRKVPAENRSWLRSGRLNQKRHYEMTDEEKSNVARCQGMKAAHLCKNPIFRCTECGNYGCTQEVADKCTEQGFKNDKCLNCGAENTRMPVMENELADIIAFWEKNEL